MNLNKKIASLEAELSGIEDRITSNNQAIEQTNSLIQRLETELKEARLTSALNPSPKSKSMVDDIRGRLQDAERDLDDMQILTEALSQKKTALNSALADLQLEIRKAEGVRMCSKAQGLIEQYNQSIILVQEAAIKGRILIEEIMQRGCRDELKAINPRMFDLLRAMLICNFTLAKFKDETCSSPNVLYADRFDRQEIVRELLA